MYVVLMFIMNNGVVLLSVFNLLKIARLYGKQFVPYLEKKPYSAFFADGSEVIVRAVEKIRADQAPPK